MKNKTNSQNLDTQKDDLKPANTEGKQDKREDENKLQNDKDHCCDGHDQKKKSKFSEFYREFMT